MSNNPFSTESLIKSISNYPIEKGDLPGHEFHGNQYTDGGGGGGDTGSTAKLHESARDMIRQNRNDYVSLFSMEKLGQQYQEQAQYHKDAAEQEAMKKIGEQLIGMSRGADYPSKYQWSKLARLVNEAPQK